MDDMAYFKGGSSHPEPPNMVIETERQSRAEIVTLIG